MAGGRVHLRQRPLSKKSEKARDIRGDLPGVFIGQIAPDARLPDSTRPYDVIAVYSV